MPHDLTYCVLKMEAILRSSQEALSTKGEAMGHLFSLFEGKTMIVQLILIGNCELCIVLKSKNTYIFFSYDMPLHI